MDDCLLDGDIFPKYFTLSHNYPNPFNPITSIDFTTSPNVPINSSKFETLQDSNKSGERIFRLTYMSVIDFRISVPVAKTTPLLSPRTSCIYHDKNNIPIAL